MNYKDILPAIIAFAISVILCPVIIPFLKKLKFGQYIRDEGPKWHQGKSGTPTMGGLVILAGIVVTSLFYIKGNTNVVAVLFVTLGFGIIGFLDDYIKVVMKRNLGLRAWQKLLLQFLQVQLQALVVFFNKLCHHFSALNQKRIVRRNIHFRNISRNTVFRKIIF